MSLHLNHIDLADKNMISAYRKKTPHECLKSLWAVEAVKKHVTFILSCSLAL